MAKGVLSDTSAMDLWWSITQMEIFLNHTQMTPGSPLITKDLGK